MASKIKKPPKCSNPANKCQKPRLNVSTRFKWQTHPCDENGEDSISKLKNHTMPVNKEKILPILFIFYIRVHLRFYNRVGHAGDLCHLFDIMHAHYIGAISDANATVAAVPNNRLSIGASSKILPIVDLRLVADKVGKPHSLSSRPRRRISRFSATDFPKPKPASKAMRFRSMPACCAAATRARQN